MVCSPPGSSVHGDSPGENTLLEWVAIPSFRGSSQPKDQTQVSHIAGDSLPSEPPWKSMNTEVGSLSLIQGDLPKPGIKPGSPALQADSLPTELPGKQ